MKKENKKKRKNRNRKNSQAKKQGRKLKRKNGGSKKKQNKRRKNGGKKSSRRSKNPTARSTGRSTASATCFESAIFYMKIWKDVVGNFEKQRKRMVKQNKTGGNKSNMSCGGQYGNKGAAQLQNLTKTL